MDKHIARSPANKSKLPRRVVIAVISLVLLFALAVTGILLFVRFGLEGSQLVAFVTHRIEIATGKRITFSSADLVWTSWDSARIRVSNLDIREKVESKPLGHVDDLHVSVSLLPILSGRLYFDEIIVDKPVIAIEPPRLFGGKDKSTPPPPQPEQRQAPAEPHVPMLYPVVKRLEIKDARADMAGSEKTVLSDIQISALDASPHGVKSFAAVGKIPAPNKTGTFTVSGQVDETPASGGEFKGKVNAAITDLPVSAVVGLLSDLQLDLPIAEGSINVSAEINGRTTDFYANGEVVLLNGMILPGRLYRQPAPIMRASAKLTAIREGENLTVDLTDIAIPGMNVGVEIKIGDLSSEKPSISISLKKADLDLHKLFPFLPQGLLQEEDRNRLKEAGLSGHLAVLGGAWSGRLSDLFDWRAIEGGLLLDAYMDKISGFVPGLSLPLSDATGRIKISNDEMRFEGISLTLGTSPIVLNGFVTDLRASPRSDLFLSMIAQGDDLKPLLECRPVVSRLPQWLSRVSDIRGGIKIDLDIKGKLSKPELQGRLNLEDFQFRVPGFNLPIRKVTGAVRFRSTGASFTSLKGSIGDSPVDISGNLSPEGMAVNGDVKLAQSDLKKLNLLPGEWSVSGTVPLSMSLKGKAAAINYSGQVDLKQNVVVIGTQIKKRSGVPMNLEASGVWNSEGVSAEEFYLILENCRISGKGFFREDGSFSASMNLPPKGVPTNALMTVVHPSLELQPGGRIEGDLTVRSSPDKVKDYAVEGNLVLNHVSLHLPFFYKRTEGLTATIRRKAKNTSFAIERVKIGNSAISGTFAINDLDTPKLDVNLESSFFDTTDFTAPPGYVVRNTWGEWLKTNRFIRFLARSRGSAVVKIAKGKTSSQVFSDFSASLEGNGAIIRATSWSTNFAEGALRGSAFFDLRESAQIPFRLEFQGDRLRAERIMPAGGEGLRLEGETSLEGKLAWTLGPKRENGGVYKTGSTEVRVLDGTIHRFQVLSKIFSLINLGSLVRGRFPDLISEGLPFQRMTWNMEVFDSKWKIKDLKLRSDAARIESSGMYFGDQGRVDFKVDVSPLVGFDTIVSGLFGNLITKNGKILTTTFRVRGLSDSPDVRLEPFEQFRSEN
jgi:hypothetical protein